MRIIYGLWLMIGVGFAQSLDERLSRLDSLSRQERVRMMNQIKMELMQMNAQERAKNIEKLRAKFQSAPSSDHHDHLPEPEHHQETTHHDWQHHHLEHTDATTPSTSTHEMQEHPQTHTAVESTHD